MLHHLQKKISEPEFQHLQHRDFQKFQTTDPLGRRILGNLLGIARKIGLAGEPLSKVGFKMKIWI